MARIIDTIIRLKDQFTPVLKQVRNATQDYAKINQRMGKDIERTGRSMQGLGKAMLPLVATGAAVFGAMLVPAMKFESQMADVRKVVDFDTPQQFKQMGDDIVKLSRVIPMTAEGLASIVAAGGQSGIARSELLDFAQTASKMGIAFDVTAEEAGQMMAQWRTAFKMNQSQVTVLADQINYLGDTTAASAAKIANVVTRIGPLADVAGVASKDIAALGATLVGMGIGEEIASTGIKNLMLGMTAGTAATKKQATAFASVGINAAEMAKRMQIDSKGAILDLMKALRQLPTHMQSSVLTQMFGKESVGAIAPLLSNTEALAENFNKVADAALYAGSMNREFAVRSKTTENALQLMKNNFTAIAINIGSVLLPPFNQFLQSVSATVGKIADWAAANPQLVETIAMISMKVLVAVAAFSVFNLVVGSVLVKIGGLIKFIGGIGKGIKAAKGILPFLAKQFSGITYLFKIIGAAAKLLFTTPVGLAILAVIALVVLVIKNWSTFGAIFSKVSKAIANEITYIINTFKEWLAKMGIIDKVSLIWSKLAGLTDSLAFALASGLELVISFVASVIGFFAGLWSYMTSGANVWSNIFLAILDGFANNASIIINGVLDVISGIITFLTGVFTGDWGKAWQGIVDVFSAIFGVVAGIAQNVLNTVKASINAVIKGINGMSFNVPEWVPGIGGSTFVPNIPMLAKGTDNWRGGVAMVHEKGAEVIDLPKGTRVVPHDKSLNSEYQRGKAEAVGNITIAKLADSIVIREDADIDKIVKKLVYELKANAINQTAKAF